MLHFYGDTICFVEHYFQCVVSTIKLRDVNGWKTTGKGVVVELGGKGVGRVDHKL